ncbi:MAG: efflux transporter periplasmic adaptor subunit [Gemmatimonadetes bacterium]|nr:efflux transporter periplasmic adaptor subunit [Gemmatimonadota bacterium]
MTRVKQSLITVAFVAAGAVGYHLLVATRPAASTRPTEPLVPLVRVLAVEPTEVRLSVSSQGTVTPSAETTLVPQVSGRVAALSPRLAEGAFFSEGEVLLGIDPTDYELAAVQAEASIARAEARVAMEEGEAELARAEWTRMGKGGEAKPLVLREPQLRDARAALAAARASLSQARLALSRTELRAPYTGRVQTKMVDVGQLVGPDTPIAQIYSVDAAEVRLPIPASELAFLDLPADPLASGDGPAVRFSADYAGRPCSWTGRIVRRSGRIDPRSQMVHLIARIERPYGDAHEVPLETGLFVRAQITGCVEDGIVELPREALKSGERVHLVSEGRLLFRSVELLRLEPERALVREGLAAGDTLCLSDIQAAVEGMRVRASTHGAAGDGGSS